jgi:hypothetical protein
MRNRNGYNVEVIERGGRFRRESLQADRPGPRSVRVTALMLDIDRELCLA